MKSCLTMILSLLVVSAAAQYTPPARDCRLAAGIAPFALGDLFDGSSIRLSIESKLYKNIALATEAGGCIPFSGTAFLKGKATGYIFKPSLKIYINRAGVATGPNLAVEYQYKQQSYHYHDSIVVNSNPPYHKDYQMKRQVSCINIKYGVTDFIYDKQFIIEWYAGIGIRIASSSSDLTREEEDGRLRGEGHGSEIGGAMRWTGNMILPNITAGIRVGYKFF